jgi:hypothetical protein
VTRAGLYVRGPTSDLKYELRWRRRQAQEQPRALCQWQGLALGGGAVFSPTHRGHLRARHLRVRACVLVSGLERQREERAFDCDGFMPSGPVHSWGVCGALGCGGAFCLCRGESWLKFDLWNPWLKFDLLLNNMCLPSARRECLRKAGPQVGAVGCRE